MAGERPLDSPGDRGIPSVSAITRTSSYGSTSAHSAQQPSKERRKERGGKKQSLEALLEITGDKR
jgi:hypothetical protein